jgi:hypothetical protein
VALDDFGAGYTSYRNLKELPISLIKLDGSFCCNLAEGGENHTFVRSMVELAHAFGLKVVAEWVDTAEDAEILARHGVDYLQGNMLGEASIIAPWKGAHGVAFQMGAASLAPVDSIHFQHVVPDIAAPRDDDAERLLEMPAAEVVDVEAGPQKPVAEPDFHTSDAEMLDDAALEAEIAALDGSNVTPVGTEVSLQPLYETALDIVPVAEAEPAPIIEDESFAEYEVPDLDDHLDQLRAALSALNAAFGERPDVEDTERLAS